MSYKNLYLVVMLFLGLNLPGLLAQQVIPASGGNAAGSGGKVSYTIGQIGYNTNVGVNGSVAQGVQQPYEISVITELEEAKGIVLQCSAYPNPTNDYVTLKVENVDPSVMFFRLNDINGKLVGSKKVAGKETSVEMNSLVTGTYFLQVFQFDKEIKTFKIIKQ